MKYKVGDKVILQKLETTCSEAIKDINNLEDGQATIIEMEKIGSKTEISIYYRTKETRHWLWGEENILCLAKDYFDPIESRFDIIDL